MEPVTALGRGMKLGPREVQTPLGARGSGGGLARVFVSYALPRLVSELRRALADDHRAPRFLRSVHGFGYAFSGTAMDVEGAAAARAPAPVCELLWGERAIPLLEGDTPIGRSPECVVRAAIGEPSTRNGAFTGAAGTTAGWDTGATQSRSATLSRATRGRP